MATPPLVQSFPYVLWILLSALAFGSFLFAVVTRRMSDATTGYLRLTAVTAAILAFLARLLDPALDQPIPALAIGPSPQEFITWRWLGLVSFVVVSLFWAYQIHRPVASLVAGVVGLVCALVALAAAAFGWAPTQPDAVPFLVQLVSLSVVTGGSLAAIVLGHWYLVTPKISERPLLLQARMLLAALVMQALLFVTWTTLGGGPGKEPFSAFETGSLLLVMLRLGVTIVFPLVLVYMALRTAQTRSMESATGLLYINLAAVMAGTIGAAALYVSSGLLV